MKPYYADDYVTLYHGDSREVLAATDVEFALVTDPPYGTGWVRGGGRVGEFVAKHERPEWDVWGTEFLRASPLMRAAVVFAPLSRRDDLRAALPGCAVVHWRKTNPRPNGPDRDAIAVWPAFLPEGIEFAAYNGDTPLHPCQKPLDLMQWALGFADPRLVVVDPFAGSGTTLVAAKNLGRRAIGIERDAAYCATIATRLSQGVLQLGGAA